MSTATNRVDRSTIAAVLVLLTLPMILIFGPVQLLPSPGMLSAAFGAAFCLDLVSAAVLAIQFRQDGRTRLAMLAGMYVYSLITTFAWSMVIPGVWTDEGLVNNPGAGPYFGTAWALVTPLATLALIRWPARWPRTIALADRDRVLRRLTWSYVALALVVLAIVWVVFQRTTAADFAHDTAVITKFIAAVVVVSWIGLLFREMDTPMERWAVLIPILNGAVPIVGLATPARFTVGHYSSRVFIILAAAFGVAAYLLSLNSSFTHARRRAEGLAQALTLTLSNTRTPTGLYEHRDHDWRLIDASAESAFPDPAPPALQDLLDLTRFTHAGRSATVSPGELGRTGGGLLSISAQSISEDQVLVSWRDASGREQAQRLSERVDTTSAVTGRPNRTALLRDLDERAKWGFRGEVLAVIDIDDFRSVNDTLGSGPADAVLGEIGRRLAERNPGDLVAHLGSDTFAVLHDGEPGASAGIDRAIRSALAAPIPTGDREVTVTASVGYAEARPWDQAADVLSHAEAALFSARSAEPGSSAVFEPSMQEHAQKERVFREELQHALDDNQFRLNFQTFHPLDGGPAIGAECLLRWQHPTRGLLGPGAFLDSADRFGLMPRIGEWVARNATAAAARSGCPLLSVNVSPSELLQPGFAENFRETCEAAGIPLPTMMIEITENTLLTSGPQALAALSALHSQGVRLALDDFGAGFAALSYLTWIPLNLVKVDRSLLHPPVGETSPAFLEGVVNLVHKVDALVLIEGVERERELQLCREAGFDLVQGFLLAMPADEDSALAQFRGDTPAEHRGRH